ncbi:hypothetical protein CAPTEDRAFT_212830 [Capitella teleta]|uniref:Uncharacterized protein n=1 Tax=Capitella teleta TaxID=283909 RepID=R7UNZ4_CAPTE|nr:hypothetical protein CAPTEDRAFT_212830 [Capitella teleta]|eukprot:ELU05086.1 hypothetical protein CAPTEDRAFT_212830 [Capitella teleta]
MRLKLAPKFTPDLLKPNHFSKMRVPNATSIISRDVSAALKRMVEKEGRPAKELPTLTPGERPPETDLRDRKQLATVASQTANPRSYTVSVPGNKLRRNRSALVRTDLHDRYVKHFGRYIIATFY